MPIVGYRAWPNFPQTPPGTILVTADFFLVAPGAILYDFMTQQDLQQLPLNYAIDLAVSGAATGLIKIQTQTISIEEEEEETSIDTDVETGALTGL